MHLIMLIIVMWHEFEWCIRCLNMYEYVCVFHNTIKQINVLEKQPDTELPPSQSGRASGVRAILDVTSVR